ncbi:aldo/keto reductase [Microlunatus elymi]|uniref:Aldo/keto reductase n=1 Tax=Microlunatus elymi TaxID=2596828 RepID=A0A516PYU8_9ACTN|nr:aldo/keto reductase [Microlunatus elymi]QDP96359.1 aldo/keto reductase [Microlunatus elymi]
MDPLTPNREVYNATPQATDYQGMPYRFLGASGLQAPAIGLGTWKFGYPDTGDGARIAPELAFRILDRAAELGVMFWDTANRYNAASGNSERIIGQWLAEHPQRRRDVVLATKTRGGMDGWTPNHSGLSRLQITESVKASLARLQTDWIDVLWFHQFDDRVPLEESLETIEDLVSRGLVHYLAVSNFNAEQLESCLLISDRLSRRSRPIAVQNRFDPLNGESLPGVLSLCASEGLAFVPYSPLAKGLLTDRYLDPAKAGPGDRLYDEGALEGIDQRRFAKVRKLGELARQWDLKISTLTLAYILTLPGMGTQIPSSSNTDQLADNARAGTITLDQDQQAALHDIFTD